MKLDAAKITKLDAIDIKILSTLQREGRITNVALAGKINLSPTPCWERLRRLETEGYITGYRAEVALDKLFKFSMFLIEVVLRRHHFEDIARFESAIRSLDPVIECYATGGGVDYILCVTAADIDAYQRFIDDLLMADVGIERYSNYVVTRTVKSCAQIPLDTLLVSDRSTAET